MKFARRRELSEVFLTVFVEKHAMPRFYTRELLVIAYHLMCFWRRQIGSGLSSEEAMRGLEQQWQNLILLLEDESEDYRQQDRVEFTATLGILGAIEKNKDLLFQIAPEFEQSFSAARLRVLPLLLNEERRLAPEDLFCEIVDIEDFERKIANAA